jgi:signal transduction histidine kinase
VTNSAKLSCSFSVAAAFLLAVGVGSVVLIDRVNHTLEDVGFYHWQINQVAETMTALRLRPANARENLPRIDDLKRLARTDTEIKEIIKAREAIESGAPPSQAIADLERVSDYYRKAAERARQQLVMIHQWAIQGVILLMGGGTVLLVGMMVLVRRWFMNPLFDVHEIIQLAIADDPTRPLPKNEMRELVAPVCELAGKVKHLESRATRAERLASAGEACTRVGQNLRNLVHSMRTMAQYERDAQATNPNTKAALEYIIATTNTMDRWVTSLVNTARPLELKSCRQAVEPILRDSVSLLNPLLAERSITVEFEPADSLPDVQLDRALFEQALVAVLKNAMDASPDESRIVVTTTCRHDDTVRVTITDEGEGMSEEVRRRACDAFFTSRKDGVGLGLTYVLRIVELHGGKIEIESEPRKGTRVHIDLPGAASSNGKPGDAHPKVTVLPSSKSALSASAHR